MNLRRWSQQHFVYLAGFAVHSLIQVGAPAVAHAQTQTPEKSWRQRHPMAFDTLVGAAAGAAAGCALGATADDSEEYPCALLIGPYALLGAAIGSVPGMITERRNQRDAVSFDELRRRVKRGTRVIVEQGGQRRTVGKVLEVSGDSVIVRSPDDTSTTTLSDRGTTWHLTSDSLNNGILIGAAFGTAVAVFNYKDGAGAAGAIAGVPIWALIGALTDRAFGHPVLTATDGAASRSVSFNVSPWMGKRSGGLSVSLGF